MNDEALRNQLIALIRAKYSVAADQLHEQRQRNALLSDDEWWEQHLTGLRSMANETMLVMMEQRKEQIIATRHVINAGEPDLQEFSARRADELLPELIEVRHQRQEHGFVTNDQYIAASMLHSQRQTEHSSKMLAARAEAEENPVRKRFLESFAANVEQDTQNLASLNDPSTVTESALEEVTARIVSRMQSLTDRQDRDLE